MDRITLLAPALLLLGTLTLLFGCYCALHAIGRPPEVRGAKHNELFGPFLAGFLVWVLGPIERMLIGRVSPNAITAASLAMCAVTGVAVGLGDLGAATWLYAVAGILDVLDGRLARLTNRQTRSGALFDSVSDRWGELFVFTGYAWILRDTPWLLAVMGAIGGSVMVSYTRARAEGLGIELRGGLMQRAERVVLVAAGTLIAAWFAVDPQQEWLVAPILGVTMLLCGAASTATAISRWVIGFRELARRDAAASLSGEPKPTAVTAPVPAQAGPHYPPIPAKLRESAELGL